MQLPPLTQVAAALRTTSEFLAQELAVPTDTPPCWTQFEWHIARAVAAMQGVSPLLHARLRWQGPGGWQRFLLGQREHSVARHREIVRLLDAVDSHARREGVALVALKGAALYARKIYAAGERPMGDIDLLIRAQDSPAMFRILDACGYASAFALRRHETFQPRVGKPVIGGRLGEHVDNPIKIEVHTRIAEQLPVASTEITQFLFPATAHSGLNEYSSPVALMMHLLLHAAGNMRARALRLVQLHDIALLAGRFSAGEWEHLLAARPDGRTLWWALAPMMMTARYYPGILPPDVFPRLGIDCPWRLRAMARRQQLTDVSWSNIRVEAFPGLEWSRTPRDAVAFMRSRIWPSREARLELKEGHAQIPGSAAIPWYGISHPARILRWIFSRPPRVQTLLSVRAALDQCVDESDIRASQ